MNTWWQDFWRNEQGAVSVETALLLVLTCAAVIMAFETLGETVNKKPALASEVFGATRVTP